jgi:putative hydrolase of the HAD superfamily
VTVVVRAVLFDADGVVQRNPPGWFEHLHSLVAPGRGRAFVDDVFDTEKPAMRGRRDFRGVLTEVTSRWPVDASVEELLAHWHRIDVHAPVVELVGELRATGLRCCLASNQNAHRAAYMRDRMGYDAVFDEQFYSCDLGALKSSAVFFDRALEVLALPASDVLLVDDKQEFVDAARDRGLRAEQWSLAEDVDRLRRQLRCHGLPV